MVEGPLLGESEEATHRRHLLVCTGSGGLKNPRVVPVLLKGQDAKSVVSRRGRAQLLLDMALEDNKVLVTLRKDLGPTQPTSVSHCSQNTEGALQVTSQKRGRGSARWNVLAVQLKKDSHISILRKSQSHFEGEELNPARRKDKAQPPCNFGVGAGNGTQGLIHARQAVCC